MRFMCSVDKTLKKGIFNHTEKLVQILSRFVTLFKCEAESYSGIVYSEFS